MLAFTSMTPWIFRYYCLEQHVFCSILFCYNDFKARSQIIWQSSYWVSLGSLSPVLNLGRFNLWIIVCNFWSKVIKDHWAFAWLSGDIFYWSPTLPITWSHHTWRKPKLHVLFMHAMSGCLSQVTQPLSYCIPGIWCVHEEASSFFYSPTTIQVDSVGSQDITEERVPILAMPCPNFLL